MWTIVFIGICIAHWKEICISLAALVSLIIFIVIISKRKKRKRAQQQQQKYYFFIGNKNTMIFHKRDCHAVRGIPVDQRMGFNTCTEAEAFGYKPCKTCNPWF